MLATMMETPEKAAPMTPVTGGIPATERGADALFQPPSVDEVGEEHGWKEGRKVGPISVMPRQLLDSCLENCSTPYLQRL